MMQIVSLIIYSIMLMGSMFTAYLYYASVDGDLRIIMIRKYLAFSLFVLTLLCLSIFGDFNGLRIASIACIPYLYFKGRLIVHFVKRK